MHTRKRFIIGVFGTKAPIESIENKLARAIGTEIVKRGAILLTGSNGTLGNEDKVKDVAVAGAKAAVLNGAEGAWIGVDPETKNGVPKLTRGDHSSIVGTKLGDKRNYLEAALCDVAIALKGGNGTTSEVTFCLALEKPVVLVGDWQEFPLGQDNRAATITELLDRTYRRVEISPEPDDFEKTLCRYVINSKLEASRMVHKHCPLPAEPAKREDIDSCASSVVRCALSYITGRTGKFPDALAAYDKHYKKLGVQYQLWLKSLD